MRDADERRVTEQYINATEHLGSPLTQVRVAGLYALERLAQTNPEQRQPVADVTASYLRMHFALPDEGDGDVRTADLDALREVHVRRVAGRVLTTHLRDPRSRPDRRGLPTDDEFWAITLDLTGATLVDFNARDGVFPGGLRCQSATFAGTARFTGARFAGEARFADVDFRGTARFTDVVFEDDVLFAGTDHGEARWFLGAKVTNLGAVVEIPGFQVLPDGSTAADSGPGGLGPGR